MNDIQAILKFLKQLKANNQKEWMQDNKSAYQTHRAAFLDLVQHTIEGLSQFDRKLIALQAKDCVFRINRDIRFSNDKTLYKTHFGAYMAPGGRKAMLPGYYLHLEPGNKSIMAAGLYKPGNDLLKMVRQEIDYNSKDFLKIVENKAWKSEFGTLEGERLSRTPQGYPQDHPLAEYLKLKSLMAVKGLKDSEVTREQFPGDVVAQFQRMHPLVKFLGTAIT